MTSEEILEQVRKDVRKACEGFLDQKISSETLENIAYNIRRVILPSWLECPELFTTKFSQNDVAITDKYGKPLDYLLVDAFIGEV